MEEERQSSVLTPDDILWQQLLTSIKMMLQGSTLTSSSDSAFKLCASFLSFICWRNISQKLKL